MSDEVRSTRAENDTEDAIISRRSIRGFAETPLDRSLVAHLLDVASHAPSGSNIQPWKVHVLMGTALAALCEELTSAYLAGEPERPEYHYYPREWRSPYIDRRRKTGWGLYAHTGVAKGDHEAGVRQRARNYRFFDAPVGMIFLIDRDMEQGSWLDYGMFLQNIMVAARARGLDTCPQQSMANYPDIVGRHIAIDANEMIVCGMALGHANPDEPANRLVTPREPAAGFARFHGI